MKDQTDKVTGELPGMWTESSGVMTAGEHLRRLQDEWRQTIEGDGGDCPCCGQFGKVYKAKLSQHFVLCLKWMADHAGDDGWVEVQKTGPRWMLKSKTYSMLEHWGFIECQTRRSGVWRVTRLGRDFLGGSHLAPAAVYIYDNRVWSTDEKEVAFRDCFGVHFNFDELMSTNFKWANLAALEK